MFHQVFEGMALGSRLADACPCRQQRWRAYILMIVFTLTAPLGILLGMAMKHEFVVHSSRVKLVQGIIDAASAGSLMYAVWVHLIGGEMSPKSDGVLDQWKRGWRVAGFIAVWFGVVALVFLNQDDD